MKAEWRKEAQAADSPEELRRLAKGKGIAMSEEQAQEVYAQMHTSGELSDEELDNVSGGGCGGYASASLDGHYYKLVNERSDSCGRFICLICGGGRGHHAASCGALDNSMGADLSNTCMYCIHHGGHQLIGDYCKLDWK